MYINKHKPYVMKIDGKWKHYENGHLCEIEDIFNQLMKDSSEDCSKDYEEYQVITRPFWRSIARSNKGNTPIKLCSKNKTFVVRYRDIYELYSIFDCYDGSTVTAYRNYQGKVVLISYETKSVIEL